MQRIEGIKSMSEHIQKRFGRVLSLPFLYSALARRSGENPLPTKFEFGKRSIEQLELEAWYQRELIRMDQQRRQMLHSRRGQRRKQSAAARTSRKS